MKSISKLIIVLLLLPLAYISGQNRAKNSKDSLGIHEILSEVIHNYPSIKKALSDNVSSEAKIGLAKTAYLPDVNITSSFTHLGPTQSITIPNLGSFQLYPDNNYSAMLNISETIYDFGKTDKNVTYEKQNQELVQSTVETLKQRLSFMLVGNFYSIVFLQEAIGIKDEELANLNEHLNFVEKKVATGSATNYEVLTTKVRISAIENQKTDLLNALQIQLSQMNSFLGKSPDNQLTLKKELLTNQIFAANDSLFSLAFKQRNEMKIARLKSKLANTRLTITNSQNTPSLNFFASGGLKNGYLPDINVITPNYALGVGIKIPIYDGSRSKYSRIQAQSDVEGNVQETELARRSIVNEVVESRANAESSLKKVTQSGLQLEQAQQAYSLAQTSFQAGAITNLDLLDSSTSVAESKLAVLKTKIDYSASLLKLKIALGEKIY